MSTSGRRGCAAVLAVGLAGLVSVSHTQTPAATQPQTQTPTQTQTQTGQAFRGGVNVVRVDVYPTRDGAMVPDLTAADFEVLEDG
ncbi:MAG: hypothetical protein Q8T13_03960, partial [Acidobacteriota bacterium]|nr:hypothetical protein [Acidobacteriota bacterium]